MIPSICTGDLSIDCANPEVTRTFYQNLTGWEAKTLYNCLALVTEHGLAILFMRCDFPFESPVWPEEPGAQQKQMHFNFQVDNLQEAVEQAIAFGATKPAVQYGANDWITLLDTEGHPFCLCAK